jgi:NADH:ubiquinone oxidoreductase subunit 5 (subunit L)/multisubunit Na+/H+ antiporter MnhA subunit
VPELSLTAIAAICAPSLPALAFVVLGLLLLVGRAPPAAFVTRLVGWAFSGSVLATLIVLFSFVSHTSTPLVLQLGSWFGTDNYHFEASLLVDRLSAPMMFLTALICGLIGRFTATYLVGEPGEPRFYLLLSMFASGMFLLVMAGSLDLLIAGWELVGMSSTLLIGFFVTSTFPVRNALRAFTIYRVCDIGLLVGTVLMHHYAQTSAFPAALGLTRWPEGAPLVHGAAINLVVLCLFWAACGKSALFPVGNWLPRAMEGPTPSSAIFYGALSVHAGAYLMLRIYPLLEHATYARVVVLLIGLLTAVTGTLMQRVQTDIKSQLAYAVSTQVGVIFVELAAGLPRLALLHLIGHALLRTVQLLRAPNVIHDVTAAMAAAEGDVAQLQRKASSPAARWLYHLAFSRFHLDAFWERTVSGPTLALARLLDRAERRYVELLAGLPSSAAHGRPRPLNPEERKPVP